MEDTESLWVICRDIKGATTQVLLDVGNSGPSWNTVRKVIGGKGFCVGVKIFEAKPDAENVAKKLGTRVNGRKDISIITLSELIAMIQKESKRLTGK